MFPCIVSVLTVLILIYFPLPSQERWYWLKHVGVLVSIAAFDVDDGVSIFIP